jgi:WD40 repeat protein
LVGNLEIVDVVDGSVEFKFPSQPDSINAISVFGNGRYVLAAGGSLGRDASIYVYDLQEKKKMFSFQNNDPVNALSVNSKLWVLASAHRSGSIKVWDLVNRRLIAVAPGHMRNVRDIEFQSEGLLLASAGYDAALWDTKFLQPLFTQSSPMSKSNESGQVRVMLDLIFGARLSGYGFDFVADGDRVAIGSGEGDIYIKSLWNDNRTITISAHEEETGIVEASPDGKSIVTAGFDGEVYGWDVSSGSKISTYSRKDKGYVGAVKFSNDGEMLAIGGESSVTVWKSDEEKPLVDINLNQWVTALIFNGQELYFGTKDQFGDSGSLKRWSAKSGDEQVEDILENTPPIATLDRNDNKLAIGYDDGKIQILDLLKNETIGEWSTGDRLQSLVWASSEKLLTASRQAVSQWTTSGELVSHLKVGRVDHMRWHPGLNVVVTETQGLVRGWYIQGGIPLNMLASEGGFEGMSWRREFKENLAGSPAVYFQTNINQSGNGLH